MAVFLPPPYTMWVRNSTHILLLFLNYSPFFLPKNITPHYWYCLLTLTWCFSVIFSDFTYLLVGLFKSPPLLVLRISNICIYDPNNEVVIQFLELFSCSSKDLELHCFSAIFDRVDHFSSIINILHLKSKISHSLGFSPISLLLVIQTAFSSP